jgi:hypothetical protein
MHLGKDTTLIDTVIVDPLSLDSTAVLNTSDINVKINHMSDLKGKGHHHSLPLRVLKPEV